MHPVLFKIGAFELRNYGLMLALSFVLGVWFTAYRAKKQNIKTGIVFDLSLIIIVTSIVGARFMYVIFHIDEFRGRWLDTINPVQSSGEIGLSGMTVIGGFVLAVICSLLYLSLKKQPVLKIADLFAPSVALGIFITRIGCYLNGCCYGKTCAPALGVVFPSNSPAGVVFSQQPIIPTQLYSSLYGMLIFFILILAEKKFRRFDGFSFFLLFTLYGIARFIIDFFRYYEHSMVLINIGTVSFSVNQGISLLLATLFGGLFLQRIHKTKPE